MYRDSAEETSYLLSPRPGVPPNLCTAAWRAIVFSGVEIVLKRLKCELWGQGFPKRTIFFQLGAKDMVACADSGFVHEKSGTEVVASV